MTKRFSIFLILGLITTGLFAQGYKITVKIKGIKANEPYLLASYYANKNQKIDSANSDKNGNVIFKGKGKLSNGIYLVVTPSRNYFEMVVSEKEQEFSIETDTFFEPEKMVFKNTKENLAFYEFNNYAAEKSLEYQGLKNALVMAKTAKDTADIQGKFRVLDSLIKVKRQEIVDRDPNLFIAKVFRCFKDLPEPVPQRNPDGSLVDSNYRYNFYKDHYWDYIDLGEDGLLRTPIFHNKLETFFTRGFLQIPDSVVKEADRFLKTIEAKGGKDLFRYSVMWITNHYEKSKVVCMDKVLHYMGTTYYCAGKTPWADSSTIRKMCEHVVKIAPTLCEKIAPPIVNLFDTTYQKEIPLYSVNSPFTVVVFWDHQCGHCKVTIPRLNHLYDSLNKAGVKFEVYAVYTQDDWEGWKKYVRNNKLKFINVGNMYGKSQYRKEYFFISTPQIYILDKNKKIRLKNIDVDGLGDILKMLSKEVEHEDHKN
ncbi:MAG: DUF5106 domain-containing protein [Flavobacteriales bacterium]|nr:DUF5106 domain-containing protein [Flavobacteriales bacterium]